MVLNDIRLTVLGLGLVFFMPNVGLGWQANDTSQKSAAVPATQVSAVNADWTQWRGPKRDGLVSFKGWPDKLDEATLTRKWSVPLGPSYSGPIVVGDKIYTTETKDKRMEIVRALDRETGKEVWKHEWKGAMSVPFFAAKNGSWIRSTPVYDSGKLYVGGILDVLVCMDAANGKELWRVDFKSKFNSPKPTFGFVSSPIVDDGFVYIQAGSGFCKINKDTGEVVWRTAVDNGGMMGSAFSSPIIAKLGGKRQAIVQTRTKLKGIALDSGSELWSLSVKSFRGMNILTPVVFDGGIFLSTYGGTTQLLDVVEQNGSFSLSQRWELPEQGHMSTAVVVDGHAYLTMKNRTITCIDLNDGVIKWKSSRLSDYSSYVSNGDKILALDSSGKLVLFKPNPNEFEKLDVRKVSDDSWAHIGIRGNQVFVRELNAMTVFDWNQAQ